MQLVSELANKIINEVQLVMTESIIVVNPEGTIIASTDLDRVGTFHEGALRVMQTKQKLYITEGLAQNLEGVQPGINLPIFFENEVIGVIGITGIPVDVEPFAELIRRMTELIIREAHFIEKKEWETRGLESFCYEWLHANEVDEEFMNRGQILGLSFNVPYRCILFQLDTETDPDILQQMQAKMENWFTHQFQKTPHDYFIRWGHGSYILLNHPKKSIPLEYELTRWNQYFQKQYSIPLAIGVGKTIESKTLARSYEEAKKALKVAKLKNTVIFYEALLLDIILEEVSEETRKEFTERVLSLLVNDSVSVDTLMTYFELNQSLKKTADALNIHINTLHYRLNQIKELTGINPKSSEGITLFYIALSFHQKDNHTKNSD